MVILINYDVFFCIIEKSKKILKNLKKILAILKLLYYNVGKVEQSGEKWMGVNESCL